jgi:hypothetical protein
MIARVVFVLFHRQEAEVERKKRGRVKMGSTKTGEKEIIKENLYWVADLI